MVDRFKKIGLFQRADKYDLDASKRDSLPPFLQKLASKKQSGQNRKQAEHAVSIFYELTQSGSCKTVPPEKTGCPPFLLSDEYKPTNTSLASRYAKPETGARENRKDASELNWKISEPSPPVRENHKLRNADWRPVFTSLKGEISMRHYSPKTLRSYSGWVGKLQAFTKSKDPQLLTPTDVKDFLTYLALERKVSASSQNQAFNALLFFFRHVLKTEFGEIKESPPDGGHLHEKNLESVYAGTFLDNSLCHQEKKKPARFLTATCLLTMRSLVFYLLCSIKWSGSDVKKKYWKGW